MKKIFQVLLIIAITISSYLIYLPTAQAASLTSPISDILTRLKISTAADHTIVFTTPSGIDVGDTVALTFATGFNISAIDVGDVTIGGNAPASAVVAGQLLTITADADTTVAPAGTATIIVGITHHVTNPGTTGSKIISIAGTFGDTGSLAVSIITDDQVVVTASVDPSFSFTISDVAIGFSTITTSAVRYATGDGAGDPAAPAGGAFKVNNINSNAGSGYSFTTKSTGSGAAAGLYSAAPVGDLIEADAVADIVLGTDGYAFCGKNAAGGALAVIAGFACETGSTAISLVSQIFASDTGVVASGSVDIDLKAGLSGTTKPGSYTDTLTIIGTANFQKFSVINYQFPIKLLKIN